LRPDQREALLLVGVQGMNYEDRCRLITPECTSFEEIEGQVNSQHDELRERVRRALWAAR
jgi:hypothetical protein